VSCRATMSFLLHDIILLIPLHKKSAQEYDSPHLCESMLKLFKHFRISTRLQVGIDESIRAKPQ
ncbi:MAG: hypothetical protein IKD69_06880, partial [Solobacterium sp.]|nr:hypothetical protein [Solobacterium sp.]